MPVNEVEDRVHNFFSHENLSQGQYSHAVGGDWPSDNGLWVNNQKQFGSLSSNTLTYNAKQSETELRHDNQHFPVPNGFNFMHTTARPEFAKNPSQVQLQSLNGYLYGQPDSQMRPDEANFLGFDTKSAQNSMNQRGSLGVSEQLLNANTSNGSDACSSLSLFGGQHQINGRQHPGLQQPLQHQQSGFTDIQHLQQQLMLRKMQEIQRQKLIPQIDTKKQIPINQASDSHEQINPVHMGFVHQHSDQSLCGGPVSSSRTPPALTQQMPTFPGNQYDGNSVSRHGVQGSNNWINMEQIQHLTLNRQTGPGQVFQGPGDEIKQDEPTISSLDPEEERILFGSDENIWDAFGSDRPSNEFASGVPSTQIGSWSALMQSAVSETCSSGLGLQEQCNLDQPPNYTKQNRWTPVESTPTPGDITSDTIEHSGQGDGIRRINSLHSSIVDSGPISSSMSSPHSDTPNLSNSHSVNHQLSCWKHVESSVKSRGSGSSGKPQHHLNKGSQISETSEDFKIHEIESRSKRESSNDSFQSTSSRQVVTAHLRENSSSDVGDSRVFPVTRQHFPNQSGQRRFQYHPMGNLDEDAEIPYEKRQAMPLQHFQGLRAQDQRNPGHVIMSGQVPTFSAEMGKDHVPHFEGVTKGSHDIRSTDLVGGYLPNLFASFNRSVDLSPSQKAPQPSQNMLELHYKVDQSKDGSTARHLNSSDGSLGGRQKSSSSNTQGFNLQISLPSQRLPLPHNPSSSVDQAHVKPNSRDKGQTPVPSMPPFQKPPHGGFTSNSFGTSLFNSQGLASTGEQSTKGSFPQNVLSVKFDQGQRINGPLGKEFLTDSLHVNPTIRQMDLQAFGHSLKPTNSYQNMDDDPCNRVTKRVKVSDNLDGHNESQSSVPTNTLTFTKAEHSDISPQMAPTWFNKYGTFKNVESLPERVDQSVSVESSGLMTHVKAGCAANTSEVGTIWKNHAQPLVVLEQSSVLPTNAGVQNHLTLRPKKRKVMSAGIHPWFVEVSGSFKNLQGICIGALEWSRATNRVMEKVDDDGDMIEDVQPITRPKSRVVFTTLLMQQLFRPPSAPFPSLDVILNHESVVYYAARLALGDACNLVSYACSVAKCISDKSVESERIDDCRLSKVVEDFTRKSRNLQDAFLSLYKRATILDLSVAFQDLEKFSIINRFARFHGMAETSSLPPQRYVTVVPFPANVPDRVQCLSL